MHYAEFAEDEVKLALAQIYLMSLTLGAVRCSL